MIWAFKNAAEAAKTESVLGRLFTEGIARVTGGKYSHVQMWLDGPRNAARCFSSFEPDGTKFVIQDLTDTALWTLVDSRHGESQRLNDWCLGRRGRRYNFTGILGIELGHSLTDPHDDFCSQCCVEGPQDVFGLLPELTGNTVAPSGFVADKHGRIGLLEYVIKAGFPVVP